MIEYVTGDLLADHTNTDNELDAIAHGCNCVGIMGKGIALSIRHAYGEAMHADYRLRCMNGEFRPGDAYRWVPRPAKRPDLFNLATQYYPGANATVEAVLTSVMRMCSQAEATMAATYHPRPIRIGIPRIGCGLGGLEWGEVEVALELAVETYPLIQLVVHDLPDPGAPAPAPVPSVPHW